MDIDKAGYAKIMAPLGSAGSKRDGDQSAVINTTDSFKPSDYSDATAQDIKRALFQGTKALSPRVFWSYPAGSAIMTKPVLGADGAIFVSTRYGAALALDSKTGQKKWDFPLKDGSCSDLTVATDGTVFIPGSGKDTTLNAVDAKTGKTKWSVNLDGEPSRAVGIGTDGTVFVGRNYFKPISSIGGSFDKGFVYALDGKNGDKKWEFNAGEMVVSTPEPGPHGLVYFGTYGNGFFAVDEKSGDKKWQFKTKAWISSTPAFGKDGQVYFGDWAKKIHAVDSKTGKSIWEFDTRGPVRGTPLVGADGTVYLGSDDKNFYAIDGKTGAKKWSRTTGGAIISSPVMDDKGIIYVGSEDGKVYAFDSKNGAKKWEFSTKDKVMGAPSIGPDGAVYVGSNDGNLYALDPSKLDSLINNPQDPNNPAKPEPDGSYAIVIHEDYVDIGGVKLPINKA